MARRPPALISCLTGALLGLVIGLGDLHRLVRVPLEEIRSWDGDPPVPRPVSLHWVASLRPTDRLLSLLDRPLISITLVLLILGFLLLGATLAGQLRLFLPAEQTGKSGALTHLDLSRLPRVVSAIVLSLWLAGAFGAVAGYTAGAHLRWLGRLAGVVGGIPQWVSGIHGSGGAILLSVLLFVALWLIWGPGGLATPEPGARRLEVAAWGLLAGLAASPAIVELYLARPWLQDAPQAFSLADRAGWFLLFRLAIWPAVVAGAYLGVLASWFRPRPLGRGTAIWAVGAAVAVAFSVAGARWAWGQRDRLDIDAAGLGERLHLPPASLGRYALLLTPRGRAIYSTTVDGTDDHGADTIRCNGQTIEAVNQFLSERNFRTKLAFRAYVHLHDCYSLDWLSEDTIRVDLTMLERAPTRAAAELLLQKLLDCPITPANRAALDRLADPHEFQWTQPFGNKWLGVAYRRFGDQEKALSYLRDAHWNENEFRALVGGIAPLTDGTVEGKVRLNGKARSMIRLGLVSLERWRWMLGPVRPFQWRMVTAMATADGQGVFAFHAVPEGRYVLIVTGGEIGRLRDVYATQAPGVVLLDRFHSRVSLPVIDIRGESSLPAPTGGPAQSTVANPMPGSAAARSL